MNFLQNLLHGASQLPGQYAHYFQGLGQHPMGPNYQMTSGPIDPSQADPAANAFGPGGAGPLPHIGKFMQSIQQGQADPASYAIPQMLDTASAPQLGAMAQMPQWGQTGMQGGFKPFSFQNFRTPRMNWMG